jgi:hypothetical protein
MAKLSELAGAMPMAPIAGSAITAKVRAPKQVKQGNLTPSQKAAMFAKANRAKQKEM